MAISPYLRDLRTKVGRQLLMLPSVSGVVFNEDDILLVRRVDNGWWSLPAGAVDPGEQPADAVIREVEEETGVEVVVQSIAGVALYPRTYPNGDICQYMNVWFRCRSVGGQARVNDDEGLAARWFPVRALPELEPSAKLRIEATLTNREGAWFARPGEQYDALTMSPVREGIDPNAGARR
ncbi:NUDIX domain-containing protein [Micromonospora yasonensis]|uniref:NUDIX domain-containing protein n=1 Tax=Micromonospora yasonensis TaxID=1128667 RepID=UPI00222E2860|nr:NUDIX domain-containing protein [Micromonospora yasonensis]MCW3840341.1 NUDIX domain-containing protein [Micromonospora yasonensis]